MVDYSEILARRGMAASKEKKQKLSSRERKLLELEKEDDFMEMARKIAGLIKEVGSLPTPRQLKLHLDIDAKKMRAVCGDTKNTDTYDLLVGEARRILLKEEGLVIGFGRVEQAPAETEHTPS